jgi:aspartate aminotransferase
MQIAERLNRIKPSPSSMAGQRARELRQAGRDIVALTAGEPDFDTAPDVIEAAIRAMRSSQTKYTDVGGTPELRAALVEKFRSENGLACTPDQVIAGTGGKQLIFNAIMCTVEKGSEVIVPAPYWVSYPDIVKLAHGTPVFVDCPAMKGFKLQPDDLARSITPRTKWLVLNAPCNPSGATYTESELRALGEVLLAHPEVWLLTDDIYEHLVYDGRKFVTMAQVVPELKDRTLVVNGASKGYAMTGWRIGYGCGPSPLIKTMVKLQSQSTSNPSSISQAAALAALTGPQAYVAERRDIFQQRRDFVVDRLNAIPGIRCHRPEGAFYAFPSCADFIGTSTPHGRRIANDTDFIAHLLEEQNLAVLQGAAYGSSPFFRISFAASEAVLEEGIGRIRRACEMLG